MTKYQLKNKYDFEPMEVTIDESAKEDFKDMMGWDEWTWNKYTIKQKE